MKVTIEFDDQEEAMTAMQGGDWKMVVWSLDQTLRYNIKHSEKDEPEFQEIRDRLHELVNDFNLNLDV